MPPPPLNQRGSGQTDLGEPTSWGLQHVDTYFDANSSLDLKASEFQSPRLQGTFHIRGY